MAINLKKWFTADPDTDIMGDDVNNQFYDVTATEAMEEDGSTKLVLLEPRAYSETQQIADELKNKGFLPVLDYVNV